VIVSIASIDDYTLNFKQLQGVKQLTVADLLPIPGNIYEKANRRNLAF
jgi:hypothetical protein